MSFNQVALPPTVPYARVLYLIHRAIHATINRVFYLILQIQIQIYVSIFIIKC